MSHLLLPSLPCLNGSEAIPSRDVRRAVDELASGTWRHVPPVLCPGKKNEARRTFTDSSLTCMMHQRAAEPCSMTVALTEARAVACSLHTRK